MWSLRWTKWHCDGFLSEYFATGSIFKLTTYKHKINWRLREATGEIQQAGKEKSRTGCWEGPPRRRGCQIQVDAFLHQSGRRNDVNEVNAGHYFFLISAPEQIDIRAAKERYVKVTLRYQSLSCCPKHVARYVISMWAEVGGRGCGGGGSGTWMEEEAIISEWNERQRETVRGVQSAQIFWTSPGPYMCTLTPIVLMWRIGWAHNNARK